MANESDIRKMLVEALRPSIQELVQEELGFLKQVKSQISEEIGSMRSEIASLKSTMTEEISNRIGHVIRDLQRLVGQEIEGRATNIRQQFVLSTAELHALRDHVVQTLRDLNNRIGTVEQRLSGAAEALAKELHGPSTSAEEARALPAEN